MPLTNLLSQIALGEDSTRQFKADVTNGESLAAEMAAFANSEGGAIFIGVADDGTTPGLSKQDVSRINQLISNASSQQVRSPLTRALEVWPRIDFIDDQAGCLFTATVHRKPVDELELAQPLQTSGTASGSGAKTSGTASGRDAKTSGRLSGTCRKIIEQIRKKSDVTIPELSEFTGVTERSVERNLQKLQSEGIVRRVGPSFGGHWEVIE